MASVETSGVEKPDKDDPMERNIRSLGSMSRLANTFNLRKLASTREPTSSFYPGEENKRPSVQQDEDYLDLDREMLTQKAIPGFARDLIKSIRGSHFNETQLSSNNQESTDFTPTRLLDRSNPFHQSSGQLKIRHIAKGDTRSEILALYQTDWFHVLLAIPTWKSMLLLSGFITLFTVLFGVIYFIVDRSSENCHFLDENQISYQAAFAFSLITSSTVGYGFVSSGDVFFFDCPLLVVVVFFQIIQAMFMNAFVVGVILQQVGRANLRAAQVVFSNKATIRCVDGKFYFSAQVFDLDRRHPVVEAHTRVYAIFHPKSGAPSENHSNGYEWLNFSLGLGKTKQKTEPPLHYVSEHESAPSKLEDLFFSEAEDIKREEKLPEDKDDDDCFPPFSTKIMRLQSPNDDLGGVLFLSLPCILMHQIDSYSPLLPKTAVNHDADNYLFKTRFPGLILRDEEGDAGDRSQCFCPVCGDDCNTLKHLLRHIKYNQFMETLELGSNAPKSENIEKHLDLDVDFFEELQRKATDEELAQRKEKIRAHLRENRVEIVVLVEGIEARSSNTFQARHSYTYEDIEFDQFFTPCLEVAPDGEALVNLNKFHRCYPVPKNPEEAEPIQSQS